LAHIALALGHADQHPITLDIGDLETDNLTEAQAPCIGGHQQGAMLRMVGGGKEALKFLDAEDLREALAIGAGRKVELNHWPAEGIDRAEADGSGDDVTRTPGQPAVDEQVVERAANLLGREVRWGAVRVRGSPCHSPEIDVLSTGGQAL
jgi:hypothetical protein